jgi:hypothetical protein
VLEEDRVRQADQQLANLRNNRLATQQRNDQLRTELTSLEGKVERKLQVMYNFTIILYCPLMLIMNIIFDSK